METCPHCGGSIEGDGNTIAFHCENVDLPADVEPDAPTLLCDTSRQLNVGEILVPDDYFIRVDGSIVILNKHNIQSWETGTGKTLLVTKGDLPTYRKIT